MRRTLRHGAGPRLVPSTRWGRVALACVVLFAILRSVAWASAQPGWFAPDEDYHWLYTEYVLTQQDFPHLDRPFATSELFGAVQLINKDGSYQLGPRVRYTGRPHGDIARMDRFEGDLREPTGEPPRQVLHAPLYYVGTVLVDWALTVRAAATRLTAMRYYSALLGGLGVWLTWLLASQVLRRSWEPLVAASFVAAQPMVAFSSATLTNDVLALATMTAVLAWCTFLLRRPPRARDGIVLGLLLGLALLTKATLLALLPIVGLTLLLVWRSYREWGRAVAGLAAWAGGVLVLVTGWWYVRVVMETGSLFGNGGDTLVAPNADTAARLPLGEAPDQAWIWLSSVYRGYWFHYLAYEVSVRDVWFYLPLVLGAVSALGLGWFGFRRRRTLLDPDRPALRQVLILLAAALALALPPLLVDVRRALAGLPQIFQLGRFLIPAYPGVAVLLVLGLTQLLAFKPRLAAAGVVVAVSASLALYWQNWVRYCIERFYGPVAGDWTETLRRVSFDKPEWITPTWFYGLGLASVLLIVGAAISTLASLRGGSDGGPLPAVEPAPPPTARGMSSSRR